MRQNNKIALVSVLQLSVNLIFATFIKLLTLSATLLALTCETCL